MTDELVPTGPVLTDSAEVLRRIVTVAMTKDGIPMWGAFAQSSHDGLSSTLRSNVDAVDIAASWDGSELAGVWPVAVGEANTVGMPCYDDGGKPCACGDGDFYPADHASIDFRVWESRGQRERAARKLREAAMSRGPLLQVTG